MIRSLRSRLLVGIIGGIILLLIVFSVIIYTVIRRSLITQFDSSLASTAQMLSAAVEQDGNTIDLELDVRKMPEFQSAEGPTYYQFWVGDGTATIRSPSLGKDDLPLFEGSPDSLVFRALPIRNGRPGRAVSFKFKQKLEKHERREKNSELERDKQQPEERFLILIVARDASDLYYQLQFLRWLLIAASGGTITLSLLVAVFVVREGLRPLNLLAEDIAAISEDNLEARIPLGSMPEEIAPIVNRLNDLLARLKKLFDRERHFTADVAHELRTPLAGMRSTLEVTLHQSRNANEYQTALSDCLSITKKMQLMVNNLLILTRFEARQMTFRCERIQLAELVDSCWRSFSQRALQRNIVFENRIPAETSCESDPDSLSMVMLNLLDNAVEYTNEAGKIWATARLASSFLEISISNTGCRFSNEEASQVFDYFWRADSSRTDTGIHCGLGLALVQRIVKALYGRTIVEVQDGGIFTVRLLLAKGPAAIYP